jgi:hypothetical protein
LIICIFIDIIFIIQCFYISVKLLVYTKLHKVYLVILFHFIFFFELKLPAILSFNLTYFVYLLKFSFSVFFT